MPAPAPRQETGHPTNPPATSDSAPLSAEAARSPSQPLAGAFAIVPRTIIREWKAQGGSDGALYLLLAMIALDKRQSVRGTDDGRLIVRPPQGGFAAILGKHRTGPKMWRAELRRADIVLEVGKPGRPAWRVNRRHPLWNGSYCKVPLDRWPELMPGPAVLWAVLCSYAGPDNDSVYPGLDLLAQTLGLTRLHSVIERRRVLEALGMIAASRRGSRNGALVYRLVKPSPDAQGTLLTVEGGGLETGKPEGGDSKPANRHREGDSKPANRGTRNRHRGGLETDIEKESPEREKKGRRHRAAATAKAAARRRRHEAGQPG